MTRLPAAARRLLLLASALTLAACASSRPYVGEPFEDGPAQAAPEAELAYRVFLIGNTAGAEEGQHTGLDVLQAQLATAGENSAVVFLGDQLRAPLPDSSAAGRADAEASLNRVAEAVAGYRGRVLLLPGDRDWGDDDPSGEALEREAAFLEDRLGEDVFVLDGGLPGPVDIKLADGLRLVALDTEWWLRDAASRPTGEVDGEDIESELDVLIALDEILAERDDDRVIVVGHHPVVSNGERGGHYSLRQHLFPLTDLWEPLWVPLPVVGSLYPLLRSYFGGRQDFSGSEYRAFRKVLPEALSAHDGVVYAAAHEFGLQYTPLRTDAVELQHHITSGGGARSAPFAAGFEAGFAHGAQGFASLQFYEDGTMWLELWEPDAAAARGRLAFRTQLEEALSEDVDPGLDVLPSTPLSYADSTRIVRADPDMAAGAAKRLLLGSNYRDVWTTPVAVPVLDLGRYGGLAPVKRGGGYQTVSLRLETPEGRQFVARQVRKRPDLLLPTTLQGTVAADVLADQMSTSNPWGALVVPRLAEAAGIYHTYPELVVVPDDPRLGVYREDFAGRLVLFEERPTDEAAGVPHLGGAGDVDSSTKMRLELREDNDARVDAEFYLRNRLFDALIGDWDRHQDQWRWAQFEPGDLDSTLRGDARTQGKVYRPIPRDRDQVFFRITGLLPRIAQFYVPGLQDFDPDYGHVGGLTENGRVLDRRILSGLSRETWHAVARNLQARMTDEAFRQALGDWPPEIDALHGERIFETLQSRRAALLDFADDWYGLLSRYVDVVGSDKHERFAVRRLSDSETEVVVHKSSKEGKSRRVLYRRVLRDDETREVRLYGLGGRDRFEIEGEGRSSVYVRAVGGPGDDRFVDRTGRRRAHFYDTARGNEVERGHARVTLSDDPEVNRYDPEESGFAVRTVFPRVGYSATEGVVLGASAEMMTSTFRREPFGHYHQLALRVATGTGAVAGAYSSRWTERFGPFDGVLNAAGATPQNVLNFYGLGNETGDDRDDDFYRVRLARAAASAGLELNLKRGLRVGLTPAADLTVVDRDSTRIAGQPGVGEGRGNAQWYAGADGLLAFGHADRLVNPRQGFGWENRARVRTGVAGTGDTFAALSSAVTVYLSPSLRPQVTLALRAGAEHVAGDFPFYEAATLGGTQNLRGYRSTRFAGRSALFQNAEVRLGLGQFRTYAAAGSFGALAFVDNGRVWADGESSSAWHQGGGGGLWLNLFDFVLASGTVGFSADGTFVNIGLGFLY